MYRHMLPGGRQANSANCPKKKTTARNCPKKEQPKLVLVNTGLFFAVLATGWYVMCAILPFPASSLNLQDVA